MSDPIRLLTSIGQALAALRFYAKGHPARDRALHASFEEALDLLSADPHPRFIFLEGDAAYHHLLVHGLKEWDWGARFEAAGIQRLEFRGDLIYEDYERFLFDVADRLNGGEAWDNVARQMTPTSIAYGSVGFHDEDADGLVAPLATAGLILELDDEIAAVEWIHDEVRQHRAMPVAEAEAVVRSLALAIHRDSQVVLPLLQLREFDQYTTTHSCNVAVLATAFAEHLGYAPDHARALGVCGLLHDIGKVAIPLDVLTKPGRLDPQERRIIEQHPTEGARMLIERERNMDLAAVVAYEHHRWADGRGYPTAHFGRSCHHASRVIQICDVFDALCTHRPYRSGMPPAVALAEIEAEAGSHFNASLVQAFSMVINGSALQVMEMGSPEFQSPPGHGNNRRGGSAT